MSAGQGLAHSKRRQKVTVELIGRHLNRRDTNLTLDRGWPLSAVNNSKHVEDGNVRGVQNKPFLLRAGCLVGDAIRTVCSYGWRVAGSWPSRALSIAVGANNDQKWRGERSLTLFKTEVDLQDVFLILSGLSGRPDEDRSSQFLIVSIRPAVGLVSHLFTEPSHNDLAKGVYS